MIAKSTSLAHELDAAPRPRVAVTIAPFDDSWPAPAWLIDTQGMVVAQTPEADFLLGEEGPRDQLQALAQATLTRDETAALEITTESFPPRSFLVRTRPVQLADGRPAALAEAVETTVKDRLIDALKASRTMFKSLIDVAGDFSFESDGYDRFSYVSGVAAGHAPWALNGQPVDMLDANAVTVFCPRDAQPPQDVWVTTATGDPACLNVAAIPIHANGVWTGARGIARDVTADRLAAQELSAARRREAMYQALIQTILSEAHALTAVEKTLEMVKSSFNADRVKLHRALGDITRGRVRRAALVLTAVCRYRGTVLGELSVERRGAPWAADDADLLARLADHLAIALAQADTLEALERLSTTDGLTQLDNRRSFETKVTRRLARLKPGKANGALLLLDLDHFKQLNDTEGHDAGDKALKLCAQVMRDQVRRVDVIARFGGDEFAVWLDRADATLACDVADRLTRGLDVARRTLTTVPLTLSIGIAVWGPQDDLISLLRRADEALYQVKRRGRNGYECAGGQI